MKYLCLICAEIVVDQMSAADAQACFEDYREYIDTLRASGHYVDCNRLLPAATATTLRVHPGGRVSTVDGPFAETKEQLGGYVVIEARDLNEAIQVAARIPGARHGCVEIRPIATDAPTRYALGQSAG